MQKQVFMKCLCVSVEKLFQSLAAAAAFVKLNKAHIDMCYSVKSEVNYAYINLI